MPKAYWIVRVSVRNQQRYPDYLAAARPAFEKYGARFIVRGGAFETMEGISRDRNVVVEFVDRDAAMACYRSPEYQTARAIRQPTPTSSSWRARPDDACWGRAETHVYRRPNRVAFSTRSRLDGRMRMCVMRNLPVVPLCRRLAALPKTPNQQHPSAHPASITRGVSRSSRTLSAGCGGRGSVGRAIRSQGGLWPVSDQERARRTALKRTAKPCGPGTRCWCQVGGG